MIINRPHRHSTKVKNPNPQYHHGALKSGKNRPALIEDLVKRAFEIMFTKTDEFMFGIRRNGRQRAIYKDRRNVIEAMIPLICARVNIITGQVMISIRDLSDEIGTTTISENELSGVFQDSCHHLLIY